MKKTILLIFVTTFLSCSFAWAAGTIISDNFDDGIIGTSIWRNFKNEPIDENYPSRYPVEQNGHLEIYNDGIEDDTAGLRTVINLPSDGYFEVQVSFNASECDEQSGLSLAVHNATTDYDHFVQFAMIGNAVMDGRKWFVMKSSGIGDEEPVITASEPTSVSTGVFYITYDAGIIDFSYTGYGAENAIDYVDVRDWTDCTDVWIALSAWSNGVLLSGAGSYFDDFCLETGPVSKPGGSYKYLLAQYYPLDEGITWNYLQTYAEGNKNYEIYCIGGTEAVGNEAADRLWNFDSGNFEEGEPDYSYECMAWTPEGLKVYKRICSDGSYSIYDPPMIKLPRSIQVGETLSNTTTITEYDADGNPIESSTLRMDITLEGQEDVEILAGSFAKCLMFSGTESDDFSDDEFTLWLATGIGEVKSTCADFDRELVSYTASGITYCPVQ
ncbi:MAG: hypothetical protein JXA81_05935 [Sedimentisphaerales bacterium]|nr:hypothetical protein [Sedimentisphaerales bacterium]